MIVRTRRHPAAEQLAQLREVTFCDDLYESAEDLRRCLHGHRRAGADAAESGPVVYAVPGSPMVGEFAVRKLLGSDAEIELIPAESFVDAVLAEVGYDPLDRGLQILNGHELPEPLVLDKPTIIAHLDRPEILAEVAARVDRVLPEGSQVRVFAGLGSADAVAPKRSLRRSTPPWPGSGPRCSSTPSPVG